MARLRPLAEHGRSPVKVPQEEGELRTRASWTYEAVTLENIGECEAKARERLKEKPELVARLEALGRHRALTYKALVLTGLRLNELRSLTVGDAVLDGDEPYATLRPEHEKARRGADIPLRADLAADLAQHLAERLQDAQRDAIRARRPVPARLSADTPLLAFSSDALRVLDLDLVAAGLARRVRGKDRKGKPSWKIDKRDERGRTFDMHAFRTTFNSLLAAAGVPLTTRRILMRHAAESVTDEHYADAKLIDLRGALDRLPTLPLDGKPERQVQAATGTDGQANGRDVRFLLSAYNPDSCGAIRRDSVRVGDVSTDGTCRPPAVSGSRNSLSVQEQSDAKQRGARRGRKAGDGIRTHDVQLGKLAFYH